VLIVCVPRFFLSDVRRSFPGFCRTLVLLPFFFFLPWQPLRSSERRLRRCPPGHNAPATCPPPYADTPPGHSSPGGFPPGSHEAIFGQAQILSSGCTDLFTTDLRPVPPQPSDLPPPPPLRIFQSPRKLRKAIFFPVASRGIRAPTVPCHNPCLPFEGASFLTRRATRQIPFFLPLLATFYLPSWAPTTRVLVPFWFLAVFF